MKVDPGGLSSALQPVAPRRSTPASPATALQTGLRDGRAPAKPILTPVASPTVSAAVAAEISRIGKSRRLGTGDMRREMTQLLDSLDALVADPRAARIAAWVVRGEMRKLQVLDGFVGGYIKG